MRERAQQLSLSLMVHPGVVGQFGDAFIRVPSTNVVVSPSRQAHVQSAPAYRPHSAALMHSSAPTLPKSPTVRPSFKLDPRFASAVDGISEDRVISRLFNQNYRRPASASNRVHDPWASAPVPSADAAPPGAARSAAEVAAEYDRMSMDEEISSAVDEGELWPSDASEGPAYSVEGAPEPAPVPSTYGLRTTIKVDKNSAPKEVVVSAGAPGSAPHHILDGHAHFFLQTGVLPESLMPSAAPRQLLRDRRASSKDLARRKRQQEESKAAAERDRLLVENVMERVRREGPAVKLPPSRSAPRLEGAPAARRAPLPPARAACTFSGSSDADDPRYTQARLGSTVLFVQRRNFEHQASLDASLGAAYARGITGRFADPIADGRVVEAQGARGRGRIRFGSRPARP